MPVTMCKTPLLVLVGVLATFASSARADGASCGDAFDQSQTRRDEGKLLDARKLLRTCGGPTCSPTQQRLCSQWLADVDARVPSFVLAAKDASGADVLETKVTMDGVEVAIKLDGRSIDADPGAHSFVFERPDGTRAETTAVAQERVKGKVVSVTFPRPASAVAPVIVPSPAARPLPQPESKSAGEWSGVKTAGAVIGGVGVAGLVVGGILGGLAFATKGSDCSGGMCNPGDSSKVYGLGNASTGAFVAGGVLLATGVTMFVFAPKKSPEQPAASVAFTPLMGPSMGGLELAGGW
jgi:hypothetical protein